DGIRDGHVTGVQTCALPILGMTDHAEWSRKGAEVAWPLRLVLQIFPDGIARAAVRQGEVVALQLRLESHQILTDVEVELRVRPRSEERRVGKGGRCRRWACA